MSGSDARALSRSLLDLCRSRKLTIATAESCTGGLVAGALTDIPGSSDVIDRGFVTYSNDAKRTMLGVKATTLDSFGAVSKETATAMAIGALEKAGVDLAVSITGIAGPGGATPGKPVGLVHFAVAARDGRILHRECRFGAVGRSTVRQRSGRRGLADAYGARARTASAGKTPPRSRQPVASAAGAIAAPQRGEAAASAAGVTRVPGAIQRVALAKRCFAEPGPPASAYPRGNRGPRLCSAPLRKGYALGCVRARANPPSHKPHPHASRTLRQTAGTRCRTWCPSASPASGS